jgi:hypothetical protein
MPPKWGIIGVVSRGNPFDPLTNAPEMGYNRGGFKGKSLSVDDPYAGWQQGIQTKI